MHVVAHHLALFSLGLLCADLLPADTGAHTRTHTHTHGVTHTNIQRLTRTHTGIHTHPQTRGYTLYHNNAIQVNSAQCVAHASMFLVCRVCWRCTLSPWPCVWWCVHVLPDRVSHAGPQKQQDEENDSKRGVGKLLRVDLASLQSRRAPRVRRLWQSRGWLQGSVVLGSADATRAVTGAGTNNPCSPAAAHPARLSVGAVLVVAGAGIAARPGEHGLEARTCSDMILNAVLPAVHSFALSDWRYPLHGWFR